ncbi:MAG: DNA primase, partial [Gordonibacter pamelaeae]|nr:DNA primase [Gordonibacter pamelaeae]
LPAAGPGGGPVPPEGGARRAGLSQPEANRRRFEREFLSLAAQHPELALAHADALASTQWHEPVHATLAQSMLATLAEDPAAPAARVIGDAARVLPQASGILTSGSMAGSAEPEPLARFLAEELAIGDAEDAVAALRAQLSDPSALPADEYEMLFQTVTAMQKDLTRRRLAHKAV